MLWANSVCGRKLHFGLYVALARSRNHLIRSTTIQQKEDSGEHTESTFGLFPYNPVRF